MLEPIDGIPIILRVYNRVKETKLFSEVIVATDDQRILQLIEENQGRAVMTLDTHISGTDRVIEAAEQLKTFEYVVNVQGDEALIGLSHLGPLVSYLNTDNPNPISTLYTLNNSEKDFHDPNCVKAIFDESQKAIYFSRSSIPHLRDKPFTEFNQHVGVYAFANKILDKIKSLPKGKLERLESLEQLRWLEAGIAIQMIEVHGKLIGVDTPDDVSKVEKLK